MTENNKDENKVVLILEKSTEQLHHTKEGNDIVLEGIFAQFGVVNNNDRIYEESEYLPHLDYLQEKISQKRLIGELDHPEKFDMTLSKVSHVIESLEYNKKERNIRGRVRLLDTPPGRIAKSLVESGIPISISSRAAGLVEPNKKVKIKRIFTFDLVADPGFENAVLEKINESLGILNENLAIYDVTSSYPNLLEEYSDTKVIQHTPVAENQNKIEKMEYVTAEELNTYSLILKEEIEKIHEKIDSSSNNYGSDLSEQVNKMNETLTSIYSYLDYLANSVDKSLKFSDYVVENLNKTIFHINELSDTLNDNVEHTEYISDKTDQVINYTEYLKEQIEKGIDYSEYLKECIEKGVNYSEYVAENVNTGIQYADYLGEQLNKGIQYSEYIGEKSNSHLKYSEYVGKTISSELKDTIAYANYLGESLNKGIAYSQYIGEQTQNLADYAEYALNEGSDSYNSGILESRQYKKGNYSNIDEKIDELISSVKKQKIDEANMNLEETKKQKVFQALNESNQESQDRELAKVLNKGQNIPLHWLNDAPKKYKKIWESLDDKSKEIINAQSKSYRLETAYQIENFWDRHASIIIEKANYEHVKPLNEVELPELGYNEKYLERIRKGLDKYSKR